MSHEVHHLVVRIEAIETVRNECLYGFFSFEQDAAGELKVICKEILMEINRNAYSLQNIYLEKEVFKTTLSGGKVDEVNQELLCLICYSELRTLVNLPCGHACVGDDCIYQYFENGDNRECPICRVRKITLTISCGIPCFVEEFGYEQHHEFSYKKQAESHQHGR